jgi:hypothetical protein
MKNSDMPAMPSKVSVNRDSGDVQPYQFGNDDFSTPGLTKREYFAGLALQGLLASGPHDCDDHGVAHDALLFANSLLAELEKEQAK